MNIEGLADMLKSSPVTIGGYAVLRDNTRKRYFLLEHPSEGIWTINGRLWYDYANTKHKFDKYELLSYQ